MIENFCARAARTLLQAMALGGFALLGGIGAAQAQSGSLPQCERYPTSQQTYACTCPADAAVGSIWGSNPYTSDSSVCGAAIHAGVITRAGGTVYAELRPGESSYSGSSANGVTTSNWGAYGTSFTFVKAARSVAVCDEFPRGDAEMTCLCEPNDAPSGAVWGSGPYTVDSDICTAAMHAGVIGAEGGVVTAVGLRGLDGYAASVRNGVETWEWGEYSESIVFNLNK